jgi:hypothetical protein
MNQVDLYIFEKEPRIKAMLLKLHSIITSCAPQIDAKLTYKIPFYYYFGRFCYLNPKSDSVDLGFCKGALMAKHYLLGRTELKEVRITNFKSLQEIQEEILKPLIFEALILNEIRNKNLPRFSSK